MNTTKEKPILFSGEMVRAIVDGRKTQTRRMVKPQGAILTDEMARAFGIRPPPAENQAVIRCPYGNPGDRLWVKETFQPVQLASEVSAWRYRATDDKGLGPWKPSIFCTRKASRITLEIEAIRVEHLKDISEDDAYDEGVGHLPGISGKELYRNLWESINGPGSWDANPWVWVITFRKLP